MDPIISDFNHSIQNVILQLKEDLKSIRTGRANPSLLENIVVETYGGQAKLKLLELASLTTEGPSTIVVMPFDQSTIQDIEKAIQKSPLGLSPKVQTPKILVTIPGLSEEQREKYKKIINQQVEEKKETMRNTRDNSRKVIKLQFEAKTLTEDGKFRLEKELDNLTQKFTAEIQSLKEAKDKEIMEV